MKKLLFILPLLCFSFGVMAFQIENMAHLTTEEGLSQNLVFDMIQDRQGFIWIGTKDGLNRYDGYNFKIYRNEPSNPKSLSSNYVTYLEEDEEGNIWVQTQPGGLHLYNAFADEFTLIQPVSAAVGSFQQSNIKGISGNDRLGWWIATTNGLYHLSADLQQIKEQEIPGVETSTSIYNLEPSQETGELYFSAGGAGIFRLDPKSGEINFSDKLSQHLATKTARKIIHTPEKNWLLLENNTIWILDSDGNLISKNEHRPPGEERRFIIDKLEQIQNGKVLGIRGRTLYEFDPDTGVFEVVVEGKYLNTFLEDRSGVLWLGTSGYGLYKFDPKTKRFGFTSKNYFDVLVPNIEETIEEAAPPSSTTFERQVFGIEKVSENRFYVLTRTTGLYEYDAISNTTIRYKEELFPDNKSASEMLAMDVSENGDIIIFGYAGVSIYHPKEELKRFIPLQELFPGFSAVSNLPIFEKLTFVKKLGQSIWVGSVESGLASYNLESGELNSYQYDPLSNNTLSSNHPLHISPDPNKPERYVWVGTDGGGLNRVDVHTKEVLRFTETEGLPNNVVYALYPDTSGYLWMSTNKGIVRLNAENLTTLSFTQSDGLQSDEYNRREHTRFKDGRILFCGVFGCNIFKPEEISLNTNKPNIAITDVSIKNESVLPLSSIWFKNSEEKTTLNIDWDQNIIGFEFAALEFSGSDKNQYKYRFPPFLNEWTDIGNRRDISFTNLDPGAYTLEVLGSNNDGIWSDKPARMGVQVLPPFWMTATFRAIVIVLFSGLIAWLVWYLSRRKYRRELQQLEYKMAVDQERLRISRDMHDDLGARLTQIRMMSEFATANKSYPEIIQSKFQDISQETRDVIQNFSEIVWSLNPQNDTLDNLADFMVSYTENFCKKIELPCRIRADEQFPEIPITSNVRHNLLSVLKEGLNNAAKYAQATEVEVGLHLENSVLIITIKDNGIGFEPGNIRHAGQGLRSMKKRMEEIGGSWQLNTQPTKGTEINITWPVSHPKG